MFKQRDNLDLLDNRDLQTRQHTSIIFKVQLQRLKICKNNVFYQGAIEWNALPLDIRAINSLESFKRVQKTMDAASVISITDEWIRYY